MIKYLFDPPGIIKSIYSDFIWDSKSPEILLTFDDGPTNYCTVAILKILSEYKIKSLFFCVGNNINNNPNLVSEILSAGHHIGNHTYNHRIITKVTSEIIHNEISQTNLLMKEKYNYEIKYFRPPHGRFNKAVRNMIEKENLKCVMWSLMSFDYKNDLNIVKFAMKKFLKRNSIIVFHDSIKSRSIIIDSLKYTINSVLEKGFQFGEVDKCLS
jgi:peptidoglycan/xylan/chitin deacetylase (PgdA/CDA1 family)